MRGSSCSARSRILKTRWREPELAAKKECRRKAGAAAGGLRAIESQSECDYASDAAGDGTDRFDGCRARFHGSVDLLHSRLRIAVRRCGGASRNRAANTGF